MTEPPHRPVSPQDRKESRGETTIATQPANPVVVAVVVTRNPGDAFEDTLASLAAQDMACPILVIDDASSTDVTARVAEVVPSAFVRRNAAPVGYCAAANLAIGMVQGATHYLFCHDDVALAPDAVRLLVAEAARTGADLLTPKLVAWNDHRRLLAVGAGMDRAGTEIPLVDPLELDQGQHDGAREVSFALGAVLLANVDRFNAIGGFDPSLTDPAQLRSSADAVGVLTGPDLGEDLDLSWRVRQAGGRIAVEPAARVAHRCDVHGIGSGDAAEGADDAGRTDADAIQSSRLRTRVLRERNRIRSMLATASAVRLPLIAPLLFVQSLFRLIAPSHRRADTPALEAWRLALRSPKMLWAQRKAVASVRVVGERDLLRGLSPIGTRARRALRNELSVDGALIWTLAGRAFTGHGRVGRSLALFRLVGLVVLVFGSRGLITGGVPAMGQLLEIPRISELRSIAWSEWQSAGVGVKGPAAPAVFVLLGLSIVTVGARSLLHSVLTIGMLPIGLIGVWRLAGRLVFAADGGREASADARTARSNARTTTTANTTTANTTAANTTTAEERARSLGRLGATFAYGALPVFVDGLRAGRLDALLAYGLLPWLLHNALRPMHLDVASDEAESTDPFAAAPIVSESVFTESIDSGRTAATGSTASTESTASTSLTSLSPVTIGPREGDELRNPSRPIDASSLRGDELRVARVARVRSTIGRAARGGVPIALVLALAPSLTLVVVVAFLGWIVGASLAAGTSRIRFTTVPNTALSATQAPFRRSDLFHADRGSAVVVLARRCLFDIVFALVLLGPWWYFVAFQRGRHAFAVSGGDQSRVAGLEFVDALRNAAGTIGRSWVSWLLPLVALLPLAIANGRRFRHGVSAVTMALIATLVVWLAGRGWFWDLVPQPSVMGVIIGLGFSLAAGAGLASTAADLQSRTFGWRQGLVGASVLALLVGAVPVGVAARDGRWGLPTRTLRDELAWMNQSTDAGSFRTAWLGSPSVLPGAPFRLGTDLAVSFSDDGLPDFLDHYGAPATAALRRIMADLERTRDGATARIGARLAPFGIRYVVVVDRLWSNGRQSPVSPDLRGALLNQFDLRAIEVGSGVTLYENTAWISTRAFTTTTLTTFGAQPFLEVGDAPEVRPGPPEPTEIVSTPTFYAPGGPFSGPLRPITGLLVASAFDSGWSLTRGTRMQRPTRSQHDTMIFPATSDSDTTPEDATLRFRSSLLFRFVLVAQGALWAAAFFFWWAYRPRRMQSRADRLRAVERTAADDEPHDLFGGAFDNDPDATGDSDFGFADEPLISVSGARQARATSQSTTQHRVSTRVPGGASHANTVDDTVPETSGLDESGLDESGLDESGLDESGLDESGHDDARVDLARDDSTVAPTRDDARPGASGDSVAADLWERWRKRQTRRGAAEDNDRSDDVDKGDS